MAQFNFGTLAINNEAAKEANEAGGKLTSGVHNVTVEGLFPRDKDGYVTFDLVFKTDNNEKGIIFGISLQEKFQSGKDNFKYAQNHALFANIGCQSFELGEAERKFGGKLELHPVLLNSVGKKVVLGVQKTISEWNGEVKEKFVLVKSWVEGTKVEGFVIEDYDTRKGVEKKEETPLPAAKKKWAR